MGLSPTHPMDSQKRSSVGQKRSRPEWKSVGALDEASSSTLAPAAHDPKTSPSLSPHTLRLLKLIQEGTASHAKLAASHLTSIAAASSPEVLWELLGRLQAFLQSPDWTCRANASVALQGVAQHIPPKDQITFLNQTFDVDDELWLSLEDFAIQPERSTVESGLDTILSNGRLLLAASESKYEAASESFENELRKLEVLDASRQEIQDFVARRVELQRRILAKRLGLAGVVDAVGSSREVLPDTISNGDLLMEDPTARQRQHMERVRKRRQHEESADQQETTTVRTLLVMEMRQQKDRHGGTASSHKNPQTLLATELIYRMFDPSWYVRHGALLGTLALLRAWNKNAGRNDKAAFGVWPQDIMARCICVLALDRFGDYGGSEGGVVAPVREMAAQLLSVLWSMAPDSVMQKCLAVLCRLGRHVNDWEVRHGSLLSLKYCVVFLSTKGQLANDPAHGIAHMLRNVADAALTGISDGMDDVRSVAAQVVSCLLDGFTADQLDRVHIITSCCVPLMNTLERTDNVYSSPSDMILLFAKILSWDCSLVLQSLAESPFGKDRDGSNAVKELVGLLDILSSVLEASESLPISLSALTAIESVAASDAFNMSDSSLDDGMLVGSICRLIETVFETYFSAAFDPQDIDENERGRRLKLIDSRDKCWLNLVIQTRSHLNAFSSFRNNLLLQLMRRYFGISDPLRMSSLAREALFGFQKPAAQGIVRLMSELVAEDPKIDLFFQTTVLTFLGSPCCGFCEAACILYQSICFFGDTGSFPATFFSGVESLMRFLNETPNRITLLRTEPQFVESTMGSCADEWERSTLTLLEYSGDMKAKGEVDLLAKCAPFPHEKEPENGGERGMAQLGDGIDQMRVRATIAGSIVAAGSKHLPEKLTPLIRAIMTSMKSETDRERSSRTCIYMVQLFKLLTAETQREERFKYTNVRNKVLENISTLACPCTPLSDSPSTPSTRTAALVIETLVADLTPGLTLHSLPPVWNRLGSLLRASDELPEEARLTESLAMLSIVSRPLDQACEVLSHLIDAVVPKLVSIACTFSFPSLRELSVHILTSLARAWPDKALGKALPTIIGHLRDHDNSAYRYGACQLLQATIDGIGMGICPFVRYLLPETMSLMVDPVEDISRQSAQSFACLVRIAPLVKRSTSCGRWPKLEGGPHSQDVIDHLINGKPLPQVELPVDILKELRLSGISLRHYQLEGIAWLDFLRTIKLNGALCDDMGCGKTIQALTAIASSHLRPRTPDIQGAPLSLIVCPSTLVSHWIAEIQKFFPSGSVLCAIPYTTKINAWPVQKKRKHNVVVTSYALLRRDVSEFASVCWDYCVLDEGHLLKNPKTATARAVKSLRARHRLILTGTPVQNRVQELWAVFDFLMPNFLGSHSSFTKDYGRPIANGHATGASAIDIKCGMEKLKLLHQQVLPFILRREKHQVLKELPPKSVIDIPCKLSDTQEYLYQKFCGDSRVRASIEAFQESMDKAEKMDTSSCPSPIGASALTSLLYLRQLCTHPALVKTRSWKRELNAGTLDSDCARLDCSGKLMALRELLQSANISNDGPMAADNDLSAIYCEPNESEDEDRFSSQLDEADDSLELESDNSVLLTSTTAEAEPPKCLIFAQFTQSLDVVEEFIFRPHMPSLRYLRLDGNVPVQERGQLVESFNTDESIKVMLLTTKVGGLGLNLTGASIVIFLENDFNPHTDLQAADRAHRLGQTKTVNIYRLVTQNTIEEKIMKVQDVKLAMSKAIVNTENSSMYSMGTDRLLDIFTFQSDDNKPASHDNDDESPNLEAFGSMYKEDEYASLSVQKIVRGFQDAP